jgi:rhodanese-related sulfurtransferase
MSNRRPRRSGRLGSLLRLAIILAVSAGAGTGWVTWRFPELSWKPNAKSAVENKEVAAQAAISADEVHALIEAAEVGEMIALIDARPADKFLAGHIAAPTILNIHGDDRRQYDPSNIEALRGFRIVLYCTSTTCHLAGLVYDMLMQEYGFTNLSIYHEGWEGWLKKGYPTEAGPEKYMGGPPPWAAGMMGETPQGFEEPTFDPDDGGGGP